MTRWLVATLLIFVTCLMPASNVLARGWHHGGGHHGSKYHYGFGFNFLIPLAPLFYRPYYAYPPYYYDPNPPESYYPRRYYPVPSHWQDRDIVFSKTQFALENVRSGVKVKWMNPNTAAGGFIIPGPAFKNAQGQWCRRYERVVALGTWSERSEGTACRQPDGLWR